MGDDGIERVEKRVVKGYENLFDWADVKRAQEILIDMYDHGLSATAKEVKDALSAYYLDDNNTVHIKEQDSWISGKPPPSTIIIIILCFWPTYVASSAIEDGYANYLRRRDVDKKKKKKKATDNNNDEQKKKAAVGAPPPSLEARASALVKKSKKLEKAVVEADKASEVAEAEEAVAARLTTRAEAMALLEAPRRALPQFLGEGGGPTTLSAEILNFGFNFNFQCLIIIIIFTKKYDLAK
jgi:hypothetical protein